MSLRSKLKFAGDFKSLSRDVIMQLLFSAALIVLVQVQWFLARLLDDDSRGQEIE